jgi:hypothetical protein
MRHRWGGVQSAWTDINSNIALTEFVYNNGSSPSEVPSDFGTYAWLAGMVAPNAPWDYKTQGQQYDAFGNFNFGATGEAAGIPLQVLQVAAGGVSTVVGTNNAAYGSWHQALLYGHPPVKSQVIAAGFAYYTLGCSK